MGVTLSHLKAKDLFFNNKEGSTMVVIEQYAWWFEPLL
jgi:hypothetical protein